MHYVATPCMHCDEAPCIEACPIEGVMYKREDGLVHLDAEKCTGCRKCVDVCPYDRIYFNDDLNIAQKCTGCSHLLDGGEWKVPRCVDACPTEAIKFGEESEFADLIAKAEVLLPETGAKPRVYYVNMPKKFIGGTIYDPVAKEVVIGATCTCAGADGISLTTKTDGFGDFWFRGLATGVDYKVTISAPGFADTVVDAVNTAKDVNLGDIPLAK
jgi:tetrathionate reductase subunit B